MEDQLGMAELEIEEQKRYTRSKENGKTQKNQLDRKNIDDSQEVNEMTNIKEVQIIEERSTELEEHFKIGTEDI